MNPNDAWEISNVAVAESCTGGLLMGRIVGIPGSGEWFAGGVVAYEVRIKHDLLNVSPGPVVTKAAAIQMAQGVRDLLKTAIGVATTGVAGPEEEEGQPIGTVFLGLATVDRQIGFHLRLQGDPADIRVAAVERAIIEIDRLRAEMVG